MLTQTQKEALAESLKSGVGRFSQVPEAEWENWPANVSKIEIPTRHGKAAAYIIKTEKGTAPYPLVLNFHGGGFIGKRMDRDELFCRKIARTLAAIVIDVDYKLAPDHPFPIAVEESWDVVRWVMEQKDVLGVDQEKIILSGHSSGGNLTAGICLQLAENPYFTPCCMLIDYAPLDLYTDPAMKKQNICDMPAERAQMYNAKYIQPEQANNPLASPVFASEEVLSSFPPTLVISAGEDRLCDEDEQFAAKLSQAGVEVTCKRFTESVHGFVINRMCEWEAALELILRFMKQHIDR